MSATTAHAYLAALLLSCAFGIVAMSTGINALAKSNDQKRQLKHDVPSAVSVSVNTHDVLDSGIVVTVVCGLIAVVSFLSLVHALFFRLRVQKRNPNANSWGPFHTRHAPRAGAATLAFLSVWLFATLVPFTDFVANRAAKISASIGGTTLNASEIQAYQSALGLTSIYHKLGYLVAGTVLAWIALLFSSLASALSFHYARQASRGAVATGSGVPAGYDDEKTQQQRLR
ncbi:hypothetical protein DAEQUDRAFT_664440 [Daedalea quercina L-15889]|uniref:Uncharacterized protein n=1 Tax=Daedalea quercina L-15889 TaxID=1314783 RepID=A0A165SR62_9APHY|nr:hypothetical protein DAEQUDRAFT_664440 [Daedalea quercina L-15889]